ncbi:hypothetical protein M569_09556, partial [Genlisea aurea]
FLSSEEEDQRNPYAFIGARDGFDFPGSNTLDPFQNQTPKIEGVYEWVKILVCLPIAALRLVLFGLCLVTGYLATLSALQGWKDRQNPMPKARFRVMWITRFCARGILFSFGYHWIKRKGKPAPREIAPIVVSNHLSYVEPIFFFYDLFPTIVSSESHDSMPFVGTIIRAMQVIYVDRFSKSSRRNAVNEIKRKASCNLFPRLLLFPEGTTSNGRAVISFQLGAFIPGFPVQPVVVRYPHVHFDQSWGNIGLGRLMFRMFTQFHNFMEVEYLPIVFPHKNGKENAVHYSQRTRCIIASALNVTMTSHTYEDYMLFEKAVQSKQENPSLYLVEMAYIQSSLNLTSSEAVDFLDIFLSMDPDSSGYIDFDGFLKGLKLKPCGVSEKIFEFLDVQNIGKITFKQFLVGSSCILKLPLFGEACEVAFSLCDVNKKDHILKQELVDSLSSSIPISNPNEMDELFALFDEDGDGRISKTEFMSCLRRYPWLIALFSSKLFHF